MNEIIEMVNTVGFPIAAYLLMWYSHNSTLKKLTDAINEIKILIKEIKKKEC